MTFSEYLHIEEEQQDPCGDVEEAALLPRGIAGFAETLGALDRSLAAYPEVYREVFEGSEEWRSLFQRKIVPQLTVNGCLVVAVAGGTNTGKSTLFNLLLHDSKSAVRSTAAATCSPVLVTGDTRYRDGLEGRILPGFDAYPLMRPEDSTRYEMPEDTLWVSASPVLPGSLVLLDTPDVDSIERRNWKVAEQIRAAGDVVVAVLTPEKYKDARVVEFFRQAHASGRLVVPVMNKANPNNGFAAARAQLAEFVRDACLEEPVCFVLPFDYGLETDMSREVPALEGDMSLMSYLSGLDVAEIKRRVYRDTLEYFLDASGRFLEGAEALSTRMRDVPLTFDRRARGLVAAYLPQPGQKMGALLHEQIRAQRSVVVRGIARFNDAALRGMKPVGAFLRRHMLRGGYTVASEEERVKALRDYQRNHLKQIVLDFVAQLTEYARDMEPMTGGLVREGLADIREDEVVEAIVHEMLGDEDQISEIFREHMARTVAQWWHSNPEQRQLLLELDALIVFAPSVLLALVGVLTAGVGAPEFLALASPAAGEVLARIMESRYSEQWVTLLQPWQEEQRGKLVKCLVDRLAEPALGSLRQVLRVFNDGPLDKLKKDWKSCQQGFLGS